jgi:hypothetical protein
MKRHALRKLDFEAIIQKGENPKGFTAQTPMAPRIGRALAGIKTISSTTICRKLSQTPRAPPDVQTAQVSDVGGALECAKN